MKRLYLLFCTVLAVTSCMEGTGDPMIEWVFEAPATKATLAGNGAFSWKSGDQIALWNETSSSFVTFTTPSGSGRFSAQAPASANFIEAAFYPAGIAATTSMVTLPAAYSIDALSTGAGIPMYAHIDDDSHLLLFKHMVAYLTVCINNVPETMDQIRISSADVSLSGSFTLEDEDGYKILPAGEGDGTILVSIEHTGTQNIVFTIPIPVGEYSIRYAVGSSQHPHMLQKYTDVIVFQRAHLYKLSATEAGDVEFSSLPCEDFTLDYLDFWE